MPRLTALEVCAGAGGQAIGLHRAGFSCVAAIEIDPDACKTLQLNNPGLDVRCADLKSINGKEFRGIDLFAGGVPCPPFSIAGKQLGPNDERDLFPTALRLIEESDPRAVLLENVRGLASARFAPYRAWILQKLGAMGYEAHWQVLYSSDYGVPQLRPRFILVALKTDYSGHFSMPEADTRQVTVADAIGDLIASRGWAGAKSWMERAKGIAPTVVGGSKKHGGADLGPTRAKRQWAELQVDGRGIANEAPPPDAAMDFLPRLTLRMVARIQGFPDDWHFAGTKTSQYRQIGNAFPPPTAHRVAENIRLALEGCSTHRSTQLSLLTAAE
jgi:DNA (cytosine-5)-methyltransferase 1